MKDLYAITDDAKNHALPYLLFIVGKNIYAMNSEYVQSIERLDKVVNIVESEHDVRGGALFHSQFIYLIDMRKLFGLESQIEEFEKSVQPEQRIKDHENWVTALEKSVDERTDFLLTDDPHQCAFGKWYYSFSSDNNVLKHQLRAIETPHNAVHNTAKLVKQLMGNGEYDAAKSIVKELRATHFKTTLSILSSLRDIVMNSLRELYIVIDSDSGRKGIIVDSIVGVEYLENIPDLPKSLQETKFIKGLGRRKDDGAIVFILNNTI